MSDALPGGVVDVVVIGGAAAGLNGALILARSRRSVVVIDSGTPRNAPAEAVHGFIVLDGRPPAEILERGREQVRRYNGRIISGEVASSEPAEPAPDGDLRFTVTLADGRTVRARRVLVATGLRDELPDVPGLAEHWGHGVVHCPYCHGWEVRDEPIGVLATRLPTGAGPFCADGPAAMAASARPSKLPQDGTVPEFPVHRLAAVSSTFPSIAHRAPCPRSPTGERPDR